MPLDDTTGLFTAPVIVPAPDETEDQRILREAWPLIDRPEKWWTGGVPCGPNKQCAITAVLFVSPGPPEKTIQYLHRAARQMGHDNAVNLNDATDHATVGRMYALAYRLAGEAGNE